MGGTVEGAALNLLGGGSDEALAPLEHFLCGAPGEGEKQDPTGGDAAFYKMADAMDERPGFPGAGACHYKEGGIAKVCRVGLRRIEGRAECGGGWGGGSW